METTRWFVLIVALLVIAYDVAAGLLFGVKATISDIIRDWEVAWWPLKIILTGLMAGLWYHLVIETNQPGVLK